MSLKSHQSREVELRLTNVVEKVEIEDMTRSNNFFHRIPESFNAFCRMVSLTAANTKRMFVVSVA